MTRTLVVNADDFGAGVGINDGIARAHAEGIVTSTSLMVRRPFAAAAVERAQSLPGLSIGLHVDLGEWVWREGVWHPVDVIPAEDAEVVSREVEGQLARFRDLVGRDPTHLDSHQHVHRGEPVRAVLGRLSEGLGVPLRGESHVRYCGEFYGQTGTGEPIPGAVSTERLLELLRALPAGVTELGCHPGEGVAHGSAYDSERELELRALCDPRARRVLEEEGIELRSFQTLMDVSARRT